MRVAFLISGGGTTMEAILNAHRSGELTGITPACVIASRKKTPGIQRALDNGIPREAIHVIPPRDFGTSDEFGGAILDACKKYSVDFVGQYGWLPLTPPNVIAKYEGMIVNQHPAPLDPGRPDFGGKGMWGSRAVAARLNFVRAVNRDFWTEATAHRVTPEYDLGPVVKAVRVPILPNDNVESLYERLFPAEYEAQIQTLQDFADRTVKEVVRTEPLVRPGEGTILEKAKRQAKGLY